MEVYAEELLNSSPVCVITTVNEDGEPDAMVTSSARYVSLSPMLLTFAIAKDRYTLRNIDEQQEFTLNIPHRKSLNDLFKVGTISFRDNPAKVAETEFKLTKGTEVNSHSIENSLGSFECHLHKKVESGDHFLIIGEILEKYEREKGYPLYHLGSNKFLHKGKVIEWKGDREKIDRIEKEDDFPLNKQKMKKI